LSTNHPESWSTPDAAHRSGTLVAGLLELYPELACYQSWVAGGRPARIVHRLDKDTSAVGGRSHGRMPNRSLTAQLAARTVRRTYLALACGALEAEAGVVDAPIGRSLRDPTRMAVAVGGREARTHYRVLARYARPLEATYLELRLETAAPIRSGCTSRDRHPVVGDARYRGDRGGRGARVRSCTPRAWLSWTGHR